MHETVCVVSHLQCSSLWHLAIHTRNAKAVDPISIVELSMVDFDLCQIIIQSHEVDPHNTGTSLCCSNPFPSDILAAMSNKLRLNLEFRLQDTLTIIESGSVWKCDTAELQMLA